MRVKDYKIATVFSNHFENEITIKNRYRVDGGSINNSFCVETNVGTFFVKNNDQNLYPKMFEEEQKGLEIIGKESTIRVPKVTFTASHEDDSFIVMEYISEGNRSSSFWSVFGGQLAALHRVTQAQYGFESNNYIGSLKQNNQYHDTWSEFFIQERIAPQLKLAIDSGNLPISIVIQFEKFYQEMDSIFPQEVPSLLHGDLWGGNYLIGSDGLPWVIDPAVYYGHREMDIAMTRLFGGFDQSFYRGYQQAFPLEEGWQKRVSYCNLYPLLVHVNLFGGSYTNQVSLIMNDFK